MNISPFAQKTKFKKERIRMRKSLLLSTALVSVFAAAQANAFEVKDGETLNLNTIFKDGSVNENIWSIDQEKGGTASLTTDTIKISSDIENPIIYADYSKSKIQLGAKNTEDLKILANKGLGVVVYDGANTELTAKKINITAENNAVFMWDKDSVLNMNADDVSIS